MRLTVYTDYTLRVMMYLTVSYPRNTAVTIQQIAQAYKISRGHLMKIVNELSQHGFIAATRGRSGGLRLARPPTEISVGQLVRMAEKDFAVVRCHDDSVNSHCAILPACNIRHVLRRAVAAFNSELDKMTLAETIAVPSVAASLLKIGGLGTDAVVIPVSAVGTRRTKRRMRDLKI